MSGSALSPFSPYKRNVELTQWAFFFNHFSEGTAIRLTPPVITNITPIGKYGNIYSPDWLNPPPSPSPT